MATDSATSAGTRPSIIRLSIKEKAALYAAYIPLFKEGGIFVPSTWPYRLGEDINILLALADDPQRYPIAGKVAWVTPARSGSDRAQGIGVRFPDDAKSQQLKEKIEILLGNHLGSGKATQTI